MTLIKEAPSVRMSGMLTLSDKGAALDSIDS
jgi:hypothetical protein